MTDRKCTEYTGIRNTYLLAEISPLGRNADNLIPSAPTDHAYTKSAGPTLTEEEVEKMKLILPEAMPQITITSEESEKWAKRRGSGYQPS